MPLCTVRYTFSHLEDYSFYIILHFFSFSTLTSSPGESSFCEYKVVRVFLFTHLDRMLRFVLSLCVYVRVCGVERELEREGKRESERRRGGGRDREKVRVRERVRERERERACER